MAVACSDQKLRCFDMPKGKLKWEVEHEPTSSTKLKFSQDGTTLFAQTGNSVGRFFNVNTGAQIGTDVPMGGLTWTARFSSDAKQLLAFVHDDEASTTKMDVISLSDHDFGLVSEIDYARAISADGSLVYFADGTGVGVDDRYSLDDLIAKAREYLDGTPVA